MIHHRRYGQYWRIIRQCHFPVEAMTFAQHPVSYLWSMGSFFLMIRQDSQTSDVLFERLPG